MQLPPKSQAAPADVKGRSFEPSVCAKPPCCLVDATSSVLSANRFPNMGSLSI